MASKAALIEFLAAGLEDTNGVPLSGYQVRTFAADGTTPKVLWEDRDKTLPTSAGKSAFALDTTGRSVVFADGVYTVKIWSSTADPDVDSPYKTYSATGYWDWRSDAVSNGVDLAGLKAITGQVVGDIVHLKWRTTAGDGAHGDFRWDSSNLSTQVTADTQSAIHVAPDSDTTGASGAWVRLHDNTLHGGWFGLVSDYDTTVPASGTDNSAALAASIAMLSDVSWGGLELPRGKYKVAPNQLIIPVRTEEFFIRGDNTLIGCPDALSTDVVLDFTNTTTAFWSISGLVLFGDDTLVTDSANEDKFFADPASTTISGVGIRLRYGSRFGEIRDCRFRALSTGIQFDGFSNDWVTVKKNVFTYCNTCLSVKDLPNALHVEDNTFSYYYSYGVNVPSAVNAGYNVTINHNAFQNGGKDFETSPSVSSIRETIGIRTETMVDIAIEDNSFETVWAPIYIGWNSLAANRSGSIVRNYARAIGGYFAYFRYADGFDIGENYFDGTNYLSTGYIYGIKSSANDLRFRSDKMFFDYAAASVTVYKDIDSAGSAMWNLHTFDLGVKQESSSTTGGTTAVTAGTTSEILTQNVTVDYPAVIELRGYAAADVTTGGYGVIAVKVGAAVSVGSDWITDGVRNGGQVFARFNVNPGTHTMALTVQAVTQNLTVRNGAALVWKVVSRKEKESTGLR